MGVERWVGWWEGDEYHAACACFPSYSPIHSMPSPSPTVPKDTYLIRAVVVVVVVAKVVRVGVWCVVLVGGDEFSVMEGEASEAKKPREPLVGEGGLWWGDNGGGVEEGEGYPSTTNPPGHPRPLPPGLGKGTFCSPARGGRRSGMALGRRRNGQGSSSQFSHAESLRGQAFQQSVPRARVLCWGVPHASTKTSSFRLWEGTGLVARRRVPCPCHKGGKVRGRSKLSRPSSCPHTHTHTHTYTHPNNSSHCWRGGSGADITAVRLRAM